MDKILKLALYLFSLITLTNCDAFQPIFGPPNVTLSCSADHVKLSRIVEVSWKPTFLENVSLSTEEVLGRIQNCDAEIVCRNGYRTIFGCPPYNKTTNSHRKWKFSIPFHEVHCSVQVVYRDDHDFYETEHTANKSCSYSVTTLKQSSTGSKNVGKPYMMQCSVYTSEKINNTMIKINWIGPDGFIRNTSRIVIHPTVSDDDIIHNSTLQFLYLRQNDIGPFTCNVTILNITLSQTFQLDNITIPASNVSITTFTNHTSQLLECNITTVRGITSSINIMWMANDTIVKRKNGSLGIIVNNLVIHRDVYRPSDVGGDGTKYYCHCLINESLVATGSFFLTSLPITTPSSIMTASPTAAIETGSAQVAIIISIILGFLLVSLSASVLILYKFRRKLYLKTFYSTTDIHFKAPTISDVGYSTTIKDDPSTCENLDTNDKVLGWIKTMQESNFDSDDSYPGNEEILKCVYGQNLRWCGSSGQATDNMECKEILLRTENDLNYDNDFEKKNNQDVSVLSSQSIQMITNNTKDDYDIQCTGESQNRLYVTLNANVVLDPDVTTCYAKQKSKNNDSDCLHQCGTDNLPKVENVKYDDAVQNGFSHQSNTKGAISYRCKNKSTSSIEMAANSDQHSLDSNDKLTEDTLTTSVSSCGINASLVEGDYINNKSSAYSAINDVNCIPMQTHNFHQNNMMSLDNETCLPTTAAVGEYVDCNIAVQQNTHMAV